MNMAADGPIPDTPPPMSPVGLGEPNDVANSVVFLASDESKFINGVELPIDNTATNQP